MIRTNSESDKQNLITRKSQAEMINSTIIMVDNSIQRVHMDPYAIKTLSNKKTETENVNLLSVNHQVHNHHH